MAERRLLTATDQTVAEAIAEARADRLRLKPDQVVGTLPIRMGPLRLNVRTGDVHCATGILSSNDIGRLYLQLSNSHESWPKEATADAVAHLAAGNPFDPVADYLNAITAKPLPLDQWQRLDHHLLGIDDPIAAAFLPRYFVAAVARVFKPGCSIRQTPVLIGPQWRGKTKLGRILFGDDNWVEGIGDLGRDALMKARTAWGVELAELDGVTRRADQERLKAFLTETVDTYRAPYDRAPERHARRFVFWATSNGPPLRDATGSTRFVCIALPDRMLPLGWAVEHRDGLWARALEQYQSGLDWDACGEAERIAIADRNNSHEEIDSWAELIYDRLSSHIKAYGGAAPLSYQQLYGWIGIPAERQNNATSKRLRNLMIAAKWNWSRRRHNGEQMLAWWPDTSLAVHTEHTVCTPRCARPNLLQGNDSGHSVHTEHTKSIKVKKLEENTETGDLPLQEASVGVSVCTVCTDRETDCAAADLPVHSAVCTAVLGVLRQGTLISEPIGSGADAFDDADDPHWPARAPW